MATKVTTGLISADAALVDLNIDANTLYVDASANRVGMGTTSPSSALHVKGDELQIEDPSGGYKLHLNADSNPIVITANDNTGANYCGFRLNTNNGGGSPVTAMHVHPGGGVNVGFGTDARTDTHMVISRSPTSATQTTPETILTLSNPTYSTSTDIKVGQGPRLVFEIPDDQSGNKATGAAIAALKEIDSDTNSQTSLAFYTSGDDETLDQNMTILSDGKVGIGLTAPTTALEVIGDVKIKEGSAYSNYGLIDVSEALLTLETYSVNTSSYPADIIFKPAGTEKMRITDDGNVGIGTTSPGDMNSSANDLVIGSGASSDNTGLTIFSNSNSSGSIHFADGTSGADAYKGYIYYTHAQDFMGIGTAGTERIRLDSSGNVGIGTTTPTELLTVFGSTSSVLDIGTDNSAEVVAEFIPDSTNARNGRLRIAGTNSPENNSLAFISDASTNVGMAFVTTGSGTKNENMMIHSTGVIQMPKQASFLAIYPAATAGGNNNIIIFGGEQHDEGGNYNQSNGRFTAPVAGKYFFTVSILLDPENTGTAYYARLAFGVNGTTSAVYGDSLNTAFACNAGTATTVSSYQSVSMSTNLNLAAGDYVTVHNAGTSPTYGTGYGSFGGFLIG